MSFHVRKRLGRNTTIGLGRHGPTISRRVGRGTVSLSRKGLGGSLRLARGLSYRWRSR